jgi:hypothetical protein
VAQPRSTASKDWPTAPSARRSGSGGRSSSSSPAPPNVYSPATRHPKAPGHVRRCTRLHPFQE